MTAVLLDLDGTLVDSVYLHVDAWGRALREAGCEVPQWRIHHGIGMGGDRLVPWLLGGHVDDHEALSDRHRELFLGRADELRPTPGALALIEDLEIREVPFLVATSASKPTKAALLEALGRTDLDATDADDVEWSKPGPDLLLATGEQLGAAPSDTLLVGDSPWDARAGQRAGVRTIGVRTGGFGPGELRDAGCVEVVDDPRALIGRL